jgi:hypothetical protein
MKSRQTHAPAVAGVKAEFSTATAYRAASRDGVRSPALAAT